jgi:hypothetical protein
MIAAIRRRLAWWDITRRTRRVTRRYRQLGPHDQAHVLITAIERDAELRRRFRAALGINMRGRDRK